MSRSMYAVLLLTLLLFLGGCASASHDAFPTVQAVAHPGTDIAQLALGRKIFTTSCTECHVARRVADYSAFAMAAQRRGDGAARSPAPGGTDRPRSLPGGRAGVRSLGVPLITRESGRLRSGPWLGNNRETFADSRPSSCFLFSRHTVMKKTLSQLFMILGLLLAFAAPGRGEESHRGFFEADLASGGKAVFFSRETTRSRSMSLTWRRAPPVLPAVMWPMTAPLAFVASNGATITGSLKDDDDSKSDDDSVTATVAGQTVTAARTPTFGPSDDIPGRFTGTARAADGSTFDMKLVIDSQNRIFFIAADGSNVLGGFGTVTLTSGAAPSKPLVMDKHGDDDPPGDDHGDDHGQDADDLGRLQRRPER